MGSASYLGQVIGGLMFVLTCGGAFDLLIWRRRPPRNPPPNRERDNP